MSNQIERLRYYDGEYLRSFDFTAEQAYHIEMRRRLNHRLHLHGIVYGLEIRPDQDSVPPDAIFYSISPGMAIDQTGREIFVPAAYSLSSENVLNRPGLMTNEPYELWLCYKEAQTGLPAAGYRDCNEKNQYTRWQELFQVVLKPVHPTKNSYIPPDCGGVRLGTVYLDNTNGWQISSNPAPDGVGRVYVGIRTQRIIAADEETDSFKIENQNVQLPKRTASPGYVDIQPSALERGNLIVEKNIVVGDDFILDNQTYKNLPQDFTKIRNGNIKITQDLFLQGDFFGYSQSDGTWYSLQQFIQSAMPRFVVGPSIPIPFPTQTANAATVQDNVTSAQFPSFPGKSQVLLSITEMDWQDPPTLDQWPKGTPINVSVTNPQINHAAPGFDTLTIQWNVGPPFQTSVGPPATWILPLTNLVVSFLVIYTP